MKSFREYVEQNDALTAPAAINAFPSEKPTWKATKSEILSYWKTLRPDIPLFLKPVAYDHTGSTYGEDGIRVTGRPEFIASVMSRLKEILNFETPATKLAVTFRQTESPTQKDAGIDKTSYVFYVQTKERGKGFKPIKPIF